MERTLRRLSLWNTTCSSNLRGVHTGRHGDTYERGRSEGALCEDANKLPEPVLPELDGYVEKPQLMLQLAAFSSRRGLQHEMYRKHSILHHVP